jgi:5-dehydro-2-deoxygluconokinase
VLRVNTRLDLITMGRVSVDLYGQQIGTRLEDVASFAKAVGGCPANVAIGAARLGLKAALLSRVGAEPMGQFVREQLAREGVDTRAIVVDRQRLTSLVLLSVRDPHTFPLIFYRENCADSALCEDDVEEAVVASAAALLVTGTHFSLPEAAKAQRKAIDIKKTHGGKVILDIDYRPNLWGIGGHGAGESRYARSEKVTRALTAVLPDCDLIVGTEEELHVAAGLEDTLEAVRRIRALSNAVIVCKRGAQGCIVFAGPAPESLDDGVASGGRDVEIYNVLGAGDAFLAGFLSGYLRDEPHEVSARMGNACGALAVSRLVCSAEFPTLAELNHYLVHGSTHRALRKDARLNHLHWATTRRRAPRKLFAMAMDGQAVPHGQTAAIPPERLARLRALELAAVGHAAGAHGDFGVILKDADGLSGVAAAVPRSLWLAQAVPQLCPGALEFEAASVATQLNEWPAVLNVACSLRYHPDDPRVVREAQERNLRRLHAACRAQQRELLLALSTGQREPGADHLSTVLSRLYELDIRPDWWQLDVPADLQAWEQCAAIISVGDEFCGGVLVELDAPLEEASRLLALAARSAIVRGFAARRTMTAAPVAAWLAATLSDEALIEDLAGRFRALAEVWYSARGHMPEGAERSAG